MSPPKSSQTPFLVIARCASFLFSLRFLFGLQSTITRKAVQRPAAKVGHTPFPNIPKSGAGTGIRTYNIEWHSTTPTTALREPALVSIYSSGLSNYTVAPETPQAHRVCKRTNAYYTELLGAPVQGD